MCTNRNSKSWFLWKSVVSTFPHLKPFFKRNELSFLYQALGACLSPYKTLLSLKACRGRVSLSNLEGFQHKLPIGLIHSETHFLHPFDITLYCYKLEMKVKCVLPLDEL